MSLLGIFRQTGVVSLGLGGLESLGRGAGHSRFSGLVLNDFQA